MLISIAINAANADELKEDVKNLYATLFPIAKEVQVQKLPPDPRIHGSNVITLCGKLRHHIEQTAKVGENFSSTSARLTLGFAQSQIQSSLQMLARQGMIKMLQRGIWKRVI